MIYLPLHLSRAFIQSRPEFIFIYGYDVIGTGCLGQPWVAHGEPNCYPVPTMYKFCPSGHVLFTDSRIDEWMQSIDKALAAVPQDGRVIVPFRKIGEGCSRLREIGPKTFAYLKSALHAIHALQPEEIKWY